MSASPLSRHARRRRSGLLAVPLLLTVLPLVGPASPAAAAPADPAAQAQPRQESEAAPRPVAVRQARGTAVPGAYIVTMRRGVDARRVARALGLRTSRVFAGTLAGSYGGFAGPLSGQQLAALRLYPGVGAIEEDQVVSTSATQAVSPSGGVYGLDRTDQRNLPLSGSYTYTATASAVAAYVIDTGIATAHPDFGGRASNAFDVYRGSGQDCNGHGTHVAGTIGATTYGIAKRVRLRGVKVLDCSGSGTVAGILAGVEWVRFNAHKPAVANLSLGGGRSPALDAAVQALSDSGVTVAAAAGNEAQDACNSSPAAAPSAITVAASDRADTRASFSNSGACVDTYAPGVGITSTWLSGATRTISGTSMASPHVAGVAALYKGRYGDASSATVSGWIITNATRNVIRSNRTGTPNRLLFKSTL